MLTLLIQHFSSSVGETFEEVTQQTIVIKLIHSLEIVEAKKFETTAQDYIKLVMDVGPMMLHSQTRKAAFVEPLSCLVWFARLNAFLFDVIAELHHCFGFAFTVKDDMKKMFHHACEFTRCE